MVVAVAAEATVATEEMAHFMKAAAAAATAVTEEMAVAAEVDMELPLTELAAVVMVSTIMGMVEIQQVQELLVSA